MTTLNKPSGHMYPWCYTCNFVAGACKHQCSYCYVSGKIAPMLHRGGNDRYYGEPRLIEKAFRTRLIVPDGYMIFIQSCGDMFGDWIPAQWIHRILGRLEEFPETTFLLQTKNPARFHAFDIPENCILGTTIETNRDYQVTKAPPPLQRFLAMKMLPAARDTMVSIEPIMDFDLPTLLSWIAVIHPAFVSVGADSGNNNLPEPSPQKLKNLLWQLELVTEVRKKKNLSRLLDPKEILKDD